MAEGYYLNEALNTAILDTDPVGNKESKLRDILFSSGYRCQRILDQAGNHLIFLGSTGSVSHQIQFVDINQQRMRRNCFKVVDTAPSKLEETLASLKSFYQSHPAKYQEIPANEENLLPFNF